MLVKLDLDRFQTVHTRTAEHLDQHDELNERLRLVFSALRELPDLMPQTVQKAFSGHTFPLLQAEDELRSCIALAHIGFYQYAIAGLRWVLELGVLSVYWDRADNAEREIQKWLASAANTPPKRGILIGLMEIPNVARYCEQTKLREDFDTLYGELSNYQHIKGVRYSSHHHTPGTSVQFNADALEAWIELAFRVVCIVTTVHLLKYPVGLQDTPVDQKFGINPPMGGFLNPWQADELRSLFEAEELAKLQAISDGDPDAQALAQAFQGRPDITEDQLEEQFLRADQRLIELQGFRAWLRTELQGHSSDHSDGESERNFQMRVDKLEAWAVERGWIEYGRRGPSR